MIAETQAATERGVIDCAAYVDGRRVGVAFSEIRAALADPRGFLWLGLYEPSEELLGEVQAAFGLHDLAVEPRNHRP